MLRIITIFITLTLATHSIAQNLVITASSLPIANIIKLITGTDAEIKIIANHATCPHEYILRPSDLSKIQDSHLLVYLDKDFEPFIHTILLKFRGNTLNIGENLKIPQNANMHLWLSLEKTNTILKVLYEKLITISPEYSERWSKNFHSSSADIKHLIEYKKQSLSSPKSIVILSDSMEYLFDDLPNINIKKLYKLHGMVSAKTLQYLTDQKSYKCILIDSHEKHNALKSAVHNTVISIDSENWSLDSYKQIIDTIKNKCPNSQ